MHIPDAVTWYKKKRIRKWVCLLAGFGGKFLIRKVYCGSELCFKIFTSVLESVQNI